MLSGVEYPATAIRLALTSASAPQAGLIDSETGNAPAIYTAGSLALQCAIFDEFDNPIDLSNVTYVEADFLADPKCPPGIPNLLASATILAESITTLVPIGSWRNGTQANFELDFTSTQMQAVAACGAKRVWLVVHALTSSGSHIIWGAGWVTLQQTGISNILNMPLLPVPTVIPLGAVYTIPAGVTITMSTPPKVLGNIVFGTDPTGRLAPGNLIIT